MTELFDRTSGRHSQQEQLRVLLDVRAAEINTCLPAVIEDYDTGTKRATVQILPMRKHVKGDVLVPELLDLPVQQPSAGRLYLGFEPKQGDECLVIFSQREAETAKETGQVYELRYSRMHNISDGFVIPFCFSSGASESLINDGVSLTECIADLAEIVRNIAAAESQQNLSAITDLIAKLEAAR